MSLASIALTSVDEVLAFLGEDAKKDALWVYYAGATDPSTLEVKDDRITLTPPGVPGGDILFATYDTLTKLTDRIIVVDSDWKFGLSYHGDAESDDLIMTGALNTLGDEEEKILKIQDRYLIERLIDRASSLINRYCNRILKTTNYAREIYYGSGFTKLLLEQYPVTRVTRLSSGRANSFSIKNTSTDANFCTVEITATTIRLIVDGGANDHDTEATLALADYDNIDLLITAIEALAKGWSCTTMATDTATRDASELLIRPSMFVDATKQAYCETVDDDITDYRLLKPTEARNEGIIEKSGAFASGQEYFFDYTAGYTDPIPYALEQACIELVAYKYGQSKRAGSEELQSETFGEGADYKYTKFNLADIKNILPDSLLAALDLFKKRRF